jgi:nickel-dependent lactate racemase
MKLELPYGFGSWQEDVDLDHAVWLEPSGHIEPVADLEQAIAAALEAPTGSKRLRSLVRPGDTVAIVVSDATRPSPTRAFLNGLTRELDAAGVPARQVTVVVATGTHRASTPSELETMLGKEHLAGFRVVVHDCHDDRNLAYLGETRRGVPVWVNRSVQEASVRILTGVITPHHLCGYSGGRKAILPGVAGIETVSRHHSYPIRSIRPALGQMTGNPAHEEALEAAQILGIDFILNAVPNPRGGGYLDVVAGDLVLAHEAGVDGCSQACQVVYNEPSDLTICSPGGHPRDINLHQAQKALTVAEMLTRSGGTIILVGECSEGLGSGFAQLFQDLTPQEILDRFESDSWSEASGKAMMFARAVSNHQIFLVSTLDKETLSTIYLHRANSIAEACQRAHLDHGSDTRIAVVPRAAGLIPTQAIEPEVVMRHEPVRT